MDAMEDGIATVLRTKSPAERIAIASCMWRFARDMVLGVLRTEHPDWGDDRIRKEAARRLSHGAV
jgi:hypothetical protein